MNTVNFDIKNYYNGLAAQYDELYTDPLSTAENFMVRDMLFELLPKDKSKIRMLDLGCGTGLAFKLLNPLLRKINIELEYTGIDISDEMINKAKEINRSKNCDFHVMDMNYLNKIDNSEYDCVVSLFGSFSHATDYEKSLKEINRVTKQAGKIFLMTYSRYSIRNIADYFLRGKKSAMDFYQDYNIRNNSIEDGCKAFFYDTSKMKSLLNKHGFKSLGFTGLNMLFELPVLKKILRKSISIPTMLKIEFHLGKLLPNLGHSLIAYGSK